MKLPKIHSEKTIAQTALFNIDVLHLEFQNGAERQYERLSGRRGSAVTVVPLLDNGDIVLIREYAVGRHGYELGLPKGGVDSGEDALSAAARELQEEAGYAAQSWVRLKSMCSSPAYAKAEMSVFLARDLTPSKLEGDEPEPLEVVTWPLSDLSSLIAHEDLTESRTIASLYMAREYLHQQERSIYE